MIELVGFDQVGPFVETVGNWVGPIIGFDQVSSFVEMSLTKLVRSKDSVKLVWSEKIVRNVVYE